MDVDLSRLHYANILDVVPIGYIQVLYCSLLPGFVNIFLGNFPAVVLPNFHQQKSKVEGNYNTSER